jgi:hypothetical protein
MKIGNVHTIFFGLCSAAKCSIDFTETIARFRVISRAERPAKLEEHSTQIGHESI